MPDTDILIGTPAKVEMVSHEKLFRPIREGELTATTEALIAAFVKWGQSMPASYSLLGHHVDEQMQARGVRYTGPWPWHRAADRLVQKLRKEGMLALNAKRAWNFTDKGYALWKELKG